MAVDTHFHPLKVRSVRPETDEAMVVSFDIPEDLSDRFRFTQGQYLTLRKRIAGEAAGGAVSPIRLMARNVDCPRCGSAQTERLSAFGSTACKSLYRCIACREPFEYFKPI